MSIFNHFKHLNLSQGQDTALIKLELFLNSPEQVFMLKGYAGTGKTTLLKGLIDYLESTSITYSVMAPTGRAAKVLRDKTGKGVTIHKSIYNFQKLVSIQKDSDDDAEHSFHYFFPINELNDEGHVIIVDESSMISSKESNHELFTFGTNILLNDLLTFSKIATSKNKIIFVGDPAQLPPVGDSNSFALNDSYFTDLGYRVAQFELTEIKRQGNNLILSNSQKIRDLLQTDKRSVLEFDFDNDSFIKTRAEDFVSHFIYEFPKPDIGNGVIISFSNSQCYHYNMAIRERIFPNQFDIVAGDLVLINSNNYHTYGVELFNGDIAKVIHVHNTLVSQSAPVYCSIGGKKEKKIIKLDFRKIVIRIPNHADDIECYIIDSLLHSVNRDLSIDDMKAMYINFMIRFKDEQKRRLETGLPSYKVGSDEFRQALKNDPFFNSIRVKFGYAITGHKAQGGEWDKVFVDYSGRVSLKNDPLRWCYTATTRGVNTVFASNAPHFGKLAKFKITNIGTIGTLPKDAVSFDGVNTSPFHNNDAHKCKSLKFWELAQKLENTDYSIKDVQSLGGFQERYTISKDDVEIILDGLHKGSGHFVDPFNIVNSVDDFIKTDLLRIVNEPIKQVFYFAYEPELAFLKELHSMMCSICDELDISITNISKGQMHVNYYLITTSICSYLQFYYNDKNQLTTAMPKTFKCENDVKLQSLIKKLLDYAS